ncbi:MAG: STAS domain-containing protein [Phycisphaerae bacterium]|nr:STAS domain-containing protein [Phycisphaerae bacterium]NUQ47666.1 STAS domain-containing protein [Phycisphaerae bacterium]
MTLNVERRGPAAIVRIIGDLIDPESNDLMRAVDDLVDANVSRIVIDAGGITFLSSAGLRDLVQIVARANADGRRVLLANVSGFVSGVLEVTRLDRFFEVCPTVDEALKRLE